MVQENSKKIVAYCGVDKGYWDTLKNTLSFRYEQFEFEFSDVYNSDPAQYHLQFLDLIDLNAHIYYIDFSTNTESQARIIKMMKRLKRFRGCTFVAVLESKSQLQDAWGSNADLYIIKSNELYAAVNHAMELTYPGTSKRPDFAMAKLKKEYKAEEDFRVGYFGPNYIHVEGNYSITGDDEVVLKTALKREVCVSKKFNLKGTADSNLYYDFKQGYDLSLVYLDPPSIPEEDLNKCRELSDPMEREKCILDLEAIKEEKEQNYGGELEAVKKKYESWLVDSLFSSSAKETKLLIVDSMMEFMRNRKEPLEKLPYTIRCLDEVENGCSEISTFLPNIIAFNFNVLGELAEDTNDTQLAQLESIIKATKKIINYRPFIIAFSCKNFSSKALQDSFRYPLIMAHTSEIDLKVITEMAAIFQSKREATHKQSLEDKVKLLRKKDPQKFGRLSSSDLEEKRFYPKKSNALSIATLEHEIILRSISESQMSFLCERTLDLQSYRFTGPANFYFRIVPVDGNKLCFRESGKNLYKAYIHGADGEDIEEIRRFVNATFQMKETEQAEKDLAAFKELNESVAQEREQQDEVPEEEGEDQEGEEVIIEVDKDKETSEKEE